MAVATLFASNPCLEKASIVYMGVLHKYRRLFVSK